MEGIRGAFSPVNVLGIRSLPDALHPGYRMELLMQLQATGKSLEAGFAPTAANHSLAPCTNMHAMRLMRVVYVPFNLYMEMYVALLPCAAEKQRSQGISQAHGSGQHYSRDAQKSDSMSNSRQLASGVAASGKLPHRYGPCEGVSGSALMQQYKQGSLHARWLSRARYASHQQQEAHLRQPAAVPAIVDMSLQGDIDHMHHSSTSRSNRNACMPMTNLPARWDSTSCSFPVVLRACSTSAVTNI